MLLSSLSPQQLEAYLERLATHIGYEEAARTRARVEAARRDDVDYTDGGIEPGVLSLAVPVRDGAGTMVAALASSTLAARRSLAELEAEFLPALQRAAASLGRAL
jgi:IclR family pca regulon transcriptional regulator